MNNRIIISKGFFLFKLKKINENSMIKEYY